MEKQKINCKNKIKRGTKTMKSKIKTCKKFCREVFLPEREKVEIQFSKKYQPIQVLRKTNRKAFANTLETMYLKGCHDIYCQKTCKNSKKNKNNTNNKNSKKTWLKSFTKKRKENLIQQGAISGCRDLIKEFPEYYKNV